MPEAAIRETGTMMNSSITGRRLLASIVIFGSLALASCGGGSSDTGGSGGGGGGGGGSNTAPTANAGPDQTVGAAAVVRLAGSGSDPDAGDTVRFSWAQTAGPSVTLSSPGSASPTFTAPGGSGGGGGIGTSVTLSGNLKYEFVPALAACRGLNMNMPEERPIRRATVQVLDQSNATVLTFQLTVTDPAGASNTDTVDITVSSGSVIATGTTDDNGDYQLAVPENTNVSLRVRAELLQTGTPGWNVEVRDNTQLTTQPLGSRPLYVLDGSVFSTGSTGTATRDLTAATGWDGTAYTTARAAAPFAILDSIYSAMQLVRGVDPAADFAPLDVFWSVNNSPVQGQGSNDENIASGEIGTSFYRSDLDSLFLLGMANADTEEFDDHVIVHEWGHYFEDNFSRSDSIGGAHGFGDRLDMRVAFGEGWATALSGIALNSPIYCDTQGQNQANGFRIDIESDTPSPRGWYNEFSVMALIYDLWDTAIEPLNGDTGSIGFEPIYRTMVDRQRISAAHTSIFSFSEELLNEAPGSSGLLADLRSYHNINGTGIYGSGETNDAGSATPQDALPVYTVIAPNGSTTTGVCSNREHDNSSAGNKLSEHRFLRMSIAVPARYRFEIVTDAATVAQLPPDDPGSAIDQSDPDLFFYRNGQIQNAVVGGAPQGLSGEANREVFTTPNVLPIGDYVMDLVEFRHRDDDTDQANFPARSCFDITIAPAP